MTDTELSEIRARCEAATPGPWVLDDEQTCILNVGPLCDDGDSWSQNDKIFATHAISDIPALLAHIDKQREEIEYLKRTIGYIAVAFSDFTMNWNVPSVNAEIEIPEAFTLAKKPDKDCEWMTINGYVDGAMEILRKREVKK